MIPEKTHSEALVALLPWDMQKKVKTEAPYALNHQIALRVLEAGDRETIWRIKETLADAIEKKNYQINGTSIHVVVEPSPMRRAQCKSYFDAWDAIKAQDAGSERFEADTKGLAIYHRPSYDVLGKVPMREHRFVWNKVLVDTHQFDYEALTHHVR